MIVFINREAKKFYLIFFQVKEQVEFAQIFRLSFLTGFIPVFQAQTKPERIGNSGKIYFTRPALLSEKKNAKFVFGSPFINTTNEICW